MNLIELNASCFVQPPAILAIAASRLLNMSAAQAATAGDLDREIYDYSIKVTLLGGEKLEWPFASKQARDERLAAIVEQMRQA
ncbi:MAG: hypothetical protein ACRYFV_01540 [Janthinobacterium lividum]